MLHFQNKIDNNFFKFFKRKNAPKMHSSLLNYAPIHLKHSSVSSQSMSMESYSWAEFRFLISFISYIVPKNLFFTAHHNLKQSFKIS